MRIQTLDNLYDLRDSGWARLLPRMPRIGVGMGTCGIGNGAAEVKAALAEALRRKGFEAALRPVGCFGFCAMEPLVNVRLPDQPLVILHKVRPEDAEEIVEALAVGTVPARLALARIEDWNHLTREVVFGYGYPEIPLWNEVPFFRAQKKIVLRNCGLINPEDIEEYIAVGGYEALHRALQMPDRAEVIEEVKKSNLRGRGGAGYPTGIKWALLAKADADDKVLVCNADEGDPGAYMNRNEIESDPHMLLEGMLIGACATGATEGVVYLRAEYPLAVERLRKAIDAARAAGLLGEGIFGTDMAFDLRLVEGAGAFVCGEETAMIASLEGKAGRPRPRPPYPAARGLWGRPTNINNVETWCNIPVIVARGGAWFAETGTSSSSGTKVFSLVGKVRNTGLVELPLGTSLRTLVYDIGGGSPGGRRVKAVQSGGPSGGCIPAALFQTPVDYESLAGLGAIMGSGGMVVMDEDTCMVDVARYFIEFSRSESCGKCVPCRVGLDQALTMLTRITRGEGTPEDLDRLSDLGQMIRECSLCGLGQTAPNPVLTTLRHFRREYEQHVRVGRCEAGVCAELFLAPCENSCPLHMRIPGFMQLLKEGRPREAAELIWLDNPLPASTGRVCQHPCEDRCRRRAIDGPLNMREVHRFVADGCLEAADADAIVATLQADRLPASGFKVGVVGAGPAGLTAAFYLALFGHEVTIYESRPEPGGMLRYALPEYRLPKGLLAREIGVIEELGVTIRCGQEIGADLTIRDLEQTHDALYLSIGTWQARPGQIEGEDGPGVLSALDLLEEVARGAAPDLGRRVVVIGGGNAAVDASRTALRLGSRVTIVYRRERPDMPAISEEVDEALEEGVGIEFLCAPHKVVRDADGKVTGMQITRMTPGDYDSSGRRRPVPTAEHEVIPCDTVILAIGEVPDSETFRKACITLDADGTVQADWRSWKTDRPHVYAGGDMVIGPANVARAMGTAKEAAAAIDRLLTGEDRKARVLKTFTYGMEFERQPKGGTRNASPVLAPDVRRDGFDEVMPGLGESQVRAEIVRCLRCDVREPCAARPAAATEAR